MQKVGNYTIICIFAKNHIMNANSIDTIINETKRKKIISNFVVFAVISSLLIIDFFPYFKTYEIINPQFLYLSIVNVILGLYFYFNSDITSAAVFPLLKRSIILNFIVLLYYFAVYLFLQPKILL